MGSSPSAFIFHQKHPDPESSPGSSGVSGLAREAGAQQKVKGQRKTRERGKRARPELCQGGSGWVLGRGSSPRGWRGTGPGSAELSGTRWDSGVAVQGQQQHRDHPRVSPAAQGTR